MSDEKIEIEKIQKKLEQLSQRQLELSKDHHQQFFLHRWLQGPDPELQSVKDEIARLERDKDNIYKILQNAASIPPPVEEKDWSDSYFYSHTLKSLGFNYPGEQLGIYVTSLTGIGIVSKALLRSYNIQKAYKAIQLRNADDIDIYLHRSGFNDPQQILRVIKSRYSYIGAAIGKFAALVGIYTAIVQLKNKNIQFN